MSRPPKSREINIFNFSFLDILACTIGALIFMLVMIMINSTGVVDVSAFQEQRDDLDEKVASLRSDLDSIQNQIQEEKSTRDQVLAAKPPKKTPQKPPTSVSKLRAQRRRLTHDLILGEKHAASLKSQIQDTTKEAKQLEKEIARIPPKPKPTQKKIEFNIPLHQKTNMPMMLFECAGNRIRPCLTSPNGEVNTEYYSEKKGPLGLYKEITPKKNGETLAQMTRQSSDYWRAMKAIDKRQHYAFFVVRPDSYDIFRAAREKMWERGIRVGWEAWKTTAPIRLGSGGRGGYQ